MRTLAALLLAVSFVSAYDITYPTATQGWTTRDIGIPKMNMILWNRADADPPTFATVLENQDSGYFQILNCNVDGTYDGYLPSEPSEGWPAGTGFRVDIVQDCDHPRNVLAQSPQFEIAEPS